MRRLIYVTFLLATGAIAQQQPAVIKTAPGGTEMGMVTRQAGPVQCNAGTNLNTSALATETTIAGIKAGTDKIPSSPATDRATAGAPFAMRLSTGAAFYDAVTEATFTGRIGEVQATPTTNTLLGRLKSIEDKLDALQTELNQKTEPANTQTISGSVTASGTVAVTGVSTEATLALIKAKTDNIDVALSTRTKAADQQHVLVDSGSTTVTQATGANLHVVVDTAPSTAVTNGGLSNLDVLLSTRTKPADQQHAIIDSGSTTVTQASGANLHVNVDSAPTTAVTKSGTWNVDSIVGALPAGNNNVGDFDIASAPNVAANNATPPGSVDAIGIEATAIGTQTSAATSGNVRRQLGALDGAQYARPFGPVVWTCALNALAATLTQCQAAPGANLRLYLTDITVQTTTTTSGTYAIQAGTGTNCATGTAALFPASGTANRFNAPITTSSASNFSFTTPLIVPANTAVCVIGVATNTISIQLQGYTAP
jgi:hypothetical protein